MTVSNIGNATDTIKEVVIKLSAFSFAPIFWDSRIERPFVAPIAIEVSNNTIGIAEVNAAIALSPKRFPIQMLSTMLYARLRNIAAIIGNAIEKKDFLVSDWIKSILVFMSLLLSE